LAKLTRTLNTGYRSSTGGARAGNANSGRHVGRAVSSTINCGRISGAGGGGGTSGAQIGALACQQIGQDA